MKNKPTVQDFYKDLLEHQQNDKLQFELLHAKLDQMTNNMPTKEDTRQIIDAINTWKIGLGIFKVSGSTLIWVGGLITAILAITGGWKVFLAYVGIAKMQ